MIGRAASVMKKKPCRGLLGALLARAAPQSAKAEGLGPTMGLEVFARMVRTHAAAPPGQGRHARAITCAIPCLRIAIFRVGALLQTTRGLECLSVAVRMSEFLHNA